MSKYSFLSTEEVDCGGAKVNRKGMVVARMGWGGFSFAELFINKSCYIKVFL
ncbi:hypothetical protein [Clostridium botulinum]|uniref:hypothetical protein n=1 Tax=Clostridium botulinum TaxID=1491 RepID=UPI0012B6A2DC|nr:hypothetical protein [Clostridium botulinum]